MFMKQQTTCLQWLFIGKLSCHLLQAPFAQNFTRHWMVHAAIFRCSFFGKEPAGWGPVGVTESLPIVNVLFSSLHPHFLARWLSHERLHTCPFSRRKPMAISMIKASKTEASNRIEASCKASIEGSVDASVKATKHTGDFKQQRMEARQHVPC
jgi:hypothetical protein